MDGTERHLGFNEALKLARDKAHEISRLATSVLLSIDHAEINEIEHGYALSKYDFVAAEDYFGDIQSAAQDGEDAVSDVIGPSKEGKTRAWVVCKHCRVRYGPDGVIQVNCQTHGCNTVKVTENRYDALMQYKLKSMKNDSA